MPSPGWTRATPARAPGLDRRLRACGCSGQGQAAGVAAGGKGGQSLPAGIAQSPRLRVPCPVL